MKLKLEYVSSSKHFLVLEDTEVFNINIPEGFTININHYYPIARFLVSYEKSLYALVAHNVRLYNYVMSDDDKDHPDYKLLNNLIESNIPKWKCYIIYYYARLQTNKKYKRWKKLNSMKKTPKVGRKIK